MDRAVRKDRTKGTGRPRQTDGDDVECHPAHLEPAAVGQQLDEVSSAAPCVTRALSGMKAPDVPCSVRRALRTHGME